MNLISDARQKLSRKRLEAIGQRNRNRDDEVIQSLGLQQYFSDAYTTTGVSGGDIAFLHDYIKKHRPKRIIEFGTGKSTWVIAKSMELYCWDQYGGDIAFISMEESEHWYDEAHKYFPKHEIPHFDNFVEIVLSDVEDYRFGQIIGKSYVKTPREHFDFCFVDGPDPHGTCNMDLIKLVEVADRPISAVVDNRKSTQIAYSVLLGRRKLIRYHTGLCLVDRVTQKDLSSTNYARNFPEKMTILKL